jgi:PAS domain S-box-containing protein
MISVLCVDDDSAYLSLTKSSLEVPGVMTVTTSLSSREALKEMETNTFDVIVSDYQMPGMNGIELLREVRAAHPGLPFILYTGKGRKEVIIEALNSGADFYLQKNSEPKIQFAELKDTIFKAVKIGELWQALHDSELRYRRLFETAQEGILILDAESGAIIDANPFLLTLIEYTRDEIIGRKLWEIGFIRDKALAEQAAVDLKRTGYIRYEDLPLETKDGRALEVEFVSNVYDVGNNNVIQCNIRDLTERNQAEEDLRETKDYLENLIQYANVPIISWNPEIKITEFNRAFEQLTGKTRDEVIGQSLDILFPDKTREQSMDLIRRILIGEHWEVVEIPVRHVSGETRIVQWNSANILDPKGTVIGTIAQGQDITERKAAAEALRTFSDDLERKVSERTSDLSDVNQKLVMEIEIRLDAEKELTKTVGEKEVLIREVHHRVKNNLQIIISLLNLQSRYMKDETTLSAFRESQNRIKAMALVHEKLYQSTDVSKIELENYIKFLGDNLFSFFGMRRKGITFTTDIKEISLAIDTAIPIGLMINELISNSLKYAFPAGRKGEISLAIHRQDHTLTILFKDNGVGIPDDFDWRNAKSLGLRLVISLVEQLQGTIELDRTAGTAVTIVVKEKE